MVLVRARTTFASRVTHLFHFLFFDILRGISTVDDNISAEDEREIKVLLV